jgi:AraC-like DNA-binding protein
VRQEAEERHGGGRRRAGDREEVVVDGLLEALVVHARLTDDVSIDEMARAAGMSRFHFSGRFREATGISPYAFILRTRVERAAELLHRGRRSVTEAAFESGFHDLGRFRHAFRAAHGVSPADYLATVSAGRCERRARASATSP